MYQSKTVVYNDLTLSSKEIVKIFSITISTALLKTYYRGEPGIISLKVEEKMKALITYFLNEIFQEWSPIKSFVNTEVTINMQPVAMNGFCMVVTYTNNDSTFIANVRYFEELANAMHLKAIQENSEFASDKQHFVLNLVDLLLEAGHRVKITIA